MTALNPTEFFKNLLKQKVVEAYNLCVSEGVFEKADIVDFDVEIPKDSANGEFSTNFAMKNVRVLKKAPALIGGEIASHIDCGEYIQSAAVAGPGFINFKMSEAYYSGLVDGVLSQGENFGKTDALNGQTVLVEFVSANPTGPMHMGNARGGIIGDCLSSVLSWAGADVKKEFYVNDAGNQVMLFGESLYARLYQYVNGEDLSLIHI